MWHEVAPMQLHQRNSTLPSCPRPSSMPRNHSLRPVCGTINAGSCMCIAMRLATDSHQPHSMCGPAKAGKMLAELLLVPSCYRHKPPDIPYEESPVADTPPQLLLPLAPIAAAASATAAAATVAASVAAAARPCTAAPAAAKPMRPRTYPTAKLPDHPRLPQSTRCRSAPLTMADGCRGGTPLRRPLPTPRVHAPRLPRAPRPLTAASSSAASRTAAAAPCAAPAATVVSGDGAGDRREWGLSKSTVLGHSRVRRSDVDIVGWETQHLVLASERSYRVEKGA